MWKYIAICLFLVLLVGSIGRDAPKNSPVETGMVKPVNPPCVVDLAKFEAMKQGMSYFQIERDIGCAGIKTSEAAYRRSITYTAVWKGSGPYRSAVSAVFQDDRLISKRQYGL